MAKFLKASLSLPLLCFYFLSPNAYAETIHHWYLGPTAGYASTNWGFLVTPDQDDSGQFNLAAMSAPIGSKDKGITLGAILGYKFNDRFAIQASFNSFSDAQITLDENNYEVIKNNFKAYNKKYVFYSKTNTYTIQMKVFLPLSFFNTQKLSFYTTLGPEITTRRDILANKSSVGGAFGAGFNYQFNTRISSDIYFDYYTGYGSSSIYPCETYIPFIYQVNTAIYISF